METHSCVKLVSEANPDGILDSKMSLGGILKKFNIFWLCDPAIPPSEN